MIDAAVQALNSDALNAALNAFWAVECIVVIAFLASPRLRRRLRARFWS